jgi:hypothetical protein
MDGLWTRKRHLCDDPVVEIGGRAAALGGQIGKGRSE